MEEIILDEALKKESV